MNIEKDYLIKQFVKEYGKEPSSFYSAPGRTELVGNHCDHQHGRVLSAALRMRACAAVLPSVSGRIRISADGFAPFEVQLSDLDIKPEEFGTSIALVRGVTAGFKNLLDSGRIKCGSGMPESESHCNYKDSANRVNSYSNFGKFKGFDAYIVSDIPMGKGLSSSAAFEVLIGRIINELGGFGLDELEIARIGMLAENNYYGKPCGLMDQTISSVGKCVTVDFLDPANPIVEEIPFAPSEHGYALCIIDTGASHDDLTDDFANIISDMAVISEHFGISHLRDLKPADFFEIKDELCERYGQRAVDRACHFIYENDRVQKSAQALKDNRFEDYLSLVNESGRSSEELLSNITSEYHPELTALSDTLSLLSKLQETLLDGRGAYRVHGGGFAGTAQAYVPLEKLDDFRKKIEAVLGVGTCLVVF